MTEPTIDDKISALLSRSAPFAPLVVLAGAGVLGALRGPGAAVLAIGGGALLGAISALWGSLRVLSGDAPLSLHEAIDIGAPSALDERKQAVLRAIKDLQNERGLGKITDEDYQQLLARYRAEAKLLLREMDDAIAPARQRAEALLEARLAGKPDGEDEAPVKAKKKKKKGSAPAEPPPEQAAEPPPEQAAGEARAVCGECSSENDGDARFCKKCGAKLAAEA